MKLTILTTHLPMGTLCYQFWVLGCLRAKDEGLNDDERENKQTALSKLPFTRFHVCTPSLISLFAELLCLLKLFFSRFSFYLFLLLWYTLSSLSGVLSWKGHSWTIFCRAMLILYQGFCKIAKITKIMKIFVSSTHAHSSAAKMFENVWERLRLQKCLKCSKEAQTCSHNHTQDHSPR